MPDYRQLEFHSLCYTSISPTQISATQKKELWPLHSRVANTKIANNYRRFFVGRNLEKVWLEISNQTFI